VPHHRSEHEGKREQQEINQPERGALAQPPDPVATGEDAGEPSVPARAADQVQSLLAEKQALVNEKQDLMNTLVRRQADFENYRKRVEKERQADRHRGVETLVEHLLPVLDAFDRALAGNHDAGNAEYRKGFELIRRQLSDALAKQGLQRIEAVGKEFDPHRHHAIESVETTKETDGTVIEELQPGYVFHDRVLRPAMVRVAAAPASKRADEN
jgi:molecular chaperone GrpE